MNPMSDALGDSRRHFFYTTHIIIYPDMESAALMDVEPGSYLDRLLGMIYGHALGDAVGLQSEFKSADEDVKIEFPYANAIRDYPKCDWTDDTDHLILAMQSLTENNMKFSPIDFARRLAFWSDNGFPELGDTIGLGLGGTTEMVIKHKKFLTEPMTAAEEIWINAGRRIAPNGSLMRTSIIGALSPHDVENTAVALCKVTHPDPRCIAACVFQSLAIYKLLNGHAADIDTLITECAHESQKYVHGTDAKAPPEIERRIRGVPRQFTDARFSDHEQEFLHYVDLAYSSGLDALELDDSVRLGYVFKCLGCSIYALQMIHLAKKYNKTPSFKKFIAQLALEAGDADTNCAVAGATLGAYLGYSKLPPDWIAALPNRKWLNVIIAKFVAASQA